MFVWEYMYRHYRWIRSVFVLPFQSPYVFKAVPNIYLRYLKIAVIKSMLLNTQACLGGIEDTSPGDIKFLRGFVSLCYAKNIPIRYFRAIQYLCTFSMTLYVITDNDGSIDASLVSPSSLRKQWSLTTRHVANSTISDYAIFSDIWCQYKCVPIYPWTHWISST